MDSLEGRILKISRRIRDVKINEQRSRLEIDAPGCYFYNSIFFRNECQKGMLVIPIIFRREHLKREARFINPSSAFFEIEVVRVRMKHQDGRTVSRHQHLSVVEPRILLHYKVVGMRIFSGLDEILNRNIARPPLDVSKIEFSLVNMPNSHSPAAPVT